MRELARLRSSRSSTWVFPGLWIILALLVAWLIGLAIMLLVKMDFFSSKPLTNEQLKSVWAFLGVALATVVTLIGTLLTGQHSRRTAALAEQAEKRLTIDTVAKTLELITDVSGGYARPARVGGAVATMMELEGGAVAIRILGDLWAADAVDSDTAVWLINRVLTESKKPDELEAAAELLLFNVPKLVPGKDDENQEHENWPALLRESWPQHLPKEARKSLLLMAVKLLMVRELAFWKERGSTFPVTVLIAALDDPEVNSASRFTLRKLDDLGVLGVLTAHNAVPADETCTRISSGSTTFVPHAWFERLVAQFEPWAHGKDVSAIAAATVGSGVPPMGEDSSPTMVSADSSKREQRISGP